MLIRGLVALGAILAIAHAVAAEEVPAKAGSALYLVEFTTGPGWQDDRAVPEQTGFAGHSANLARLRKNGALLFGARYADKGVVLLRLPDEAAVRAELAADPALDAGVFRASVHEFHPFYPGEVPAVEPRTAE